jgi:amino acid transporter
VTLLFGLDISFRSLCQIKFSGYGRWHILTCIIGALLLAFLTWIPAHLSPSHGPCLPNLISSTAHYAQAGVAIAVTLIATNIICAAVVTVCLMKQSKLDRNERLQASVVVYYLITGTLILVSTSAPNFRVADQALVSCFAVLCPSFYASACYSYVKAR